MENNATALLVMDMQLGILGMLPQQGAEIAEKVSAAVTAARDKGVQVIFVRLGFRKGFPEVNPANKLFSGLKDRLDVSNMDAFMQIHPALGMVDTDIIVDKKRISAFTGSDLEMILRAANISHLVLTGIATSGVVLSTLREAFDKDYQLTILSDGCTDSDQEIHRFLVEKILPKQAEVLTIDEWKGKAS